MDFAKRIPFGHGGQVTKGTSLNILISLKPFDINPFFVCYPFTASHRHTNRQLGQPHLPGKFRGRHAKLPDSKITQYTGGLNKDRIAYRGKTAAPGTGHKDRPRRAPSESMRAILA